MLIRGVKVLVLVLRGADFALPSIFQHFVAIQIFQVSKIGDFRRGHVFRTSTCWSYKEGRRGLIR